MYYEQITKVYYFSVENLVFKDMMSLKGKTWFLYFLGSFLFRNASETPTDKKLGWNNLFGVKGNI